MRSRLPDEPVRLVIFRIVHSRVWQGRSGPWDLVRWILRSSCRPAPAQRGATHLSHWIWQAGALSKLHWSTNSCSKTKPSPLPSLQKEKFVSFCMILIDFDDSRIFFVNLWCACWGAFVYFLFFFVFVERCEYIWWQFLLLDTVYFSSSIGSFFPWGSSGKLLKGCAEMGWNWRLDGQSEKFLLRSNGFAEIGLTVKTW